LGLARCHPDHSHPDHSPRNLADYGRLLSALDALARCVETTNEVARRMERALAPVHISPLPRRLSLARHHEQQLRKLRLLTSMLAWLRRHDPSRT